MDRKTFEQQKAFAGKCVPSMKRRCIDHDYTERRMYMVTLVTEGRRKLFGEIYGRSEAPTSSADAPRMVLSKLGEAVEQIWLTIADHHPEIKVLALQMMPDHLHCILFVRQKMKKPLGAVILGVKQACNQAYRATVGYVAVPRQQTQQQQPQQQPQRHTGHERGLLFERGYNDRILLQEGQLQRWIDYLADNPRRLLAKREHPDLFRVQFGLEYAGLTFASLGNRFLLYRPYKLQVQCSRSLSKEGIQAEIERYITAARQGAVLVSPAISEGEKGVMRAALDEHLPLIFLSANIFTSFTKPGGTFTEACSHGDLLILAPWSNRTTTQQLTRAECLALKAQKIATA